MPPRLHQTYVMTTDLERSIAFYTTVLELPVAERGDASVAFETGDCTLKVEADHDEDALAAFGMEPPGEDRGRGVVLVVAVDDVDAVARRASNHGTCEVLAPPRETEWGRYLCLVEDPDGYVVEVSRPAH